MFELNNKVIIVSGGTGILGGAFIKAIAGQGGKVVILGRNAQIGNKRAAEINEGGGEAIFVAANVLEKNDLEIARDKVLSTFGRIDGLVNGAGTRAKEASKTLRLIQTGNVGFYIFMMVAGIVALLIYGFYYLA